MAALRGSGHHRPFLLHPSMADTEEGAASSLVQRKTLSTAHSVSGEVVWGFTPLCP